MAKRRRMNSQRRARVGIDKEPLGKDEIEQPAEWHQNEQRPKESVAWNMQSHAGREPSANHRARDYEKQKAPSVTVGRGIEAGGLKRCG